MRPVYLILFSVSLLSVACGESASTQDSAIGAGSETSSPPSSSDDTSTSESASSESSPQDETTDTGDIDYGDTAGDDTASQRLPSTGDDHRDAAQEFSLDIIQTYFDNDAPSWERLVHDPLYLAGTNTVYERSEYTGMMLDPTQFPAGHDLTSYSMEDYLRVYDAGVYTFQEASDNFGLPVFDEDAWIPEDDEFLFVGFFRREGIPYSEEFMPVGLVLFVVGKRDGAWKIIGLIPQP